VTAVGAWRSALGGVVCAVPVTRLRPSFETPEASAFAKAMADTSSGKPALSYSPYCPTSTIWPRGALDPPAGSMLTANFGVPPTGLVGQKVTRRS
jgi:hypothetical protein